MNGKIEKLVVVVSLALLVVVVQGCKKEEPAPEQTSRTQTEQLAAAAKEAATEVAEQAAEMIVQKTCPVMEGPINEALFVEYKGKKVYFCCEGCRDKFQADPEQYVAKLPQFQQ